MTVTCPTREAAGIGKSDVIYNIDALALFKTIYLVESITNSLTLGDQGIAIGGKIMSEYQVSRVLESPVQRVVIALDPDAMRDAHLLAMKFISSKKVKVVQFPEGKDVNDLGKKIAMRYIKNTKPSTYGRLLSERMKYYG